LKIGGRTTGLAMLFALHGSVSIAQETVSAPVNFTVIDERIESDKKQKTLSYLVTSCDYAVRRLGDKTAPNRVDALHDDLVRIKGAALEGKTLTVTQYNIYFNRNARMRGQVYSNYTGVVAGVMEKQGSNCPREKAGGGWFDAAELTGPFSPLVVDVKATLEGVPYNTRVVFTPAREVPGDFRTPEDVAILAAAMHKAAEAIAGQLP
jgi:hypothetical protein